MRSDKRSFFAEFNNEEFYFFQTGCYTKVKDPRLLFYLSIAVGRNVKSKLSARVLALCKMQPALSKSWTRFTMSIFNDVTLQVLSRLHLFIITIIYSWHLWQFLILTPHSSQLLLNLTYSYLVLFQLLVRCHSAASSWKFASNKRRNDEFIAKEKLNYVIKEKNPGTWKRKKKKLRYMIKEKIPLTLVINNCTMKLNICLLNVSLIWYKVQSVEHLVCIERTAD